MLTKTGSKMNPQLKNKLISILTNPDYDGLTQKEIAEKLQVSRDTVYRYLTTELWAEVRKLRLEIISKSLAMVDRALFEKAAKGDIQAAKLIYSRWDEQSENIEEKLSLEQLEQLNEEIAYVQKQITDFEEKASESLK